jgi:ribosomal protein S21
MSGHKNKQNGASKVRGIEVSVKYTSDKKHRDDVDSALTEFKKLVKKSGILQEISRREFYKSPAKTRRFKREESQRQKRRDERKQQWYSKNHNNF